MRKVQSTLLVITLLMWAGSAAIAAAPVSTDDGVVFTYDNSGAGAVFLAGDFNGWSDSANPMAQGDGGLWTLTVALDPGQHEYKFVVDGNWLEDPANPLKKADPFGGSNSMVDVAADGSVAATTVAAPVASQPKSAAAGDGLTVTYTAGAAASVSIAGDFNGWSDTANPLTKGDGDVWSTQLTLDDGTYEYKFVVDGNWLEDPANPEKNPDPYGGNNSVLTVSGGVAAAAGTGAASPAPKAAAASVDNITVGAPRAVEGGIEFTLEEASATAVFLAGSFNGWNATELPLATDGSGKWIIVHDVAAGEGQYKFVVDGNWIADPDNPDSKSDEYGGSNSLIVVNDKGELVAAGSSESGTRPASNNALNTKLYVDGRYMTRLEFAKNVLDDPRYRMQRPSQSVDLNFNTTISELATTKMRLRLDSDQNIIQNNVAAFLDEAHLEIHPDNFNLHAYWNEEIYTGEDLMLLGGNIDLPGTIGHDHVDFGKGSAGALFTANPFGVKFRALFANIHNYDYYNDPDLYDNTGDDRLGLRLSKEYGNFEIGIPMWLERQLLWLNFEDRVGLPSTDIPALDDYLANNSDSSTWFEAERHDYQVGLEGRYRVTPKVRLGLQGMYVHRLERFVTGNESGQNNTNGAIDVPFLDRDTRKVRGQIDWKFNDQMDLMVQHTWQDGPQANADDRTINITFLDQEIANKEIYFTVEPSPVPVSYNYTELFWNRKTDDLDVHVWAWRRTMDFDFGAVGETVPNDPSRLTNNAETYYFSGLVGSGRPTDKFGHGELEFGLTWDDPDIDRTKFRIYEFIARYDRNLTKTLAAIADVRYAHFEENVEYSTGETGSKKSDFFNPFIGLRYQPIRQLELVAGYGVDPVDYSIDYSGRQLGRWWYRQNYLFENPDATREDAEKFLADARVFTLRAQLVF